KQHRNSRVGHEDIRRLKKSDSSRLSCGKLKNSRIAAARLGGCLGLRYTSCIFEHHRQERQREKEPYAENDDERVRPLKPGQKAKPDEPQRQMHEVEKQIGEEPARAERRRDSRRPRFVDLHRPALVIDELRKFAGRDFGLDKAIGFTLVLKL